MKKILILTFLVCSLFSCSSDDGVSIDRVFVPIESVSIPDTFQIGQTYEISVTYFRPSGCHIFYDYYYEINENERTIAVINSVYDNADCVVYEPEENEVEVSFNFLVNSIDTYTFKFWQGQDETGNDMYFIVEVPVEEED